MTPPSEPVAWDVAERVAGRVARRASIRIDWATLRSLVTDFEEVTAQAEALVERVDRPALAGRARAGAGRHTGGVDPRQRLLVPAFARPGARACRQGRPGPPGCPRPGGQGGGRGRDGRRARVDVRASARPVRLAVCGRRFTPGRRVLRGAEHRLAGAPARVRTPGVPALDRAARADAPCPVHRRALAARPLPRSRRTQRRHRLARPAPGDGGPRANGRRHPVRPEPACGVRARRGTRLAGAAGDSPLDPGDDEPPRRPWRRHDGPRRRGPDPERRSLFAGSPRAARVRQRARRSYSSS